MARAASRTCPWLRKPILLKTVLIVVAFLLILNLSLVALSDGVRDKVPFWHVSGGSSSSVEFSNVPDNTPLNNTQFGERGNRVNRLAQWTESVLQNPSSDKGAFEDALVTLFPFLAGATIYMPWSSPGAQDREPPSYVICAGSNNLNMAAHLIRSLRAVHSSQTLIEVAYGGEDDLKPQHRQFLADLEPRVSFIDLLQRFPAAERDILKGGWAMKPFALLAAASPRAILMDADALFLTSPDSLFDTHPDLKRTGTLFFHDRAMRGGEGAQRDWVRAQLEAAGREPSKYLAEQSLFYRGDTWLEQESGVVVVDRSNPRVLLGLMFTTWMNTKDVRDQVTYRTFHGDKETFWLAMELAGLDYYFQPWYAGMVGTITEDQPTSDLAKDHVEVCGRHMVHLDHLGEPFWLNGGIYDNKDHPAGGNAVLTHYLVPGRNSELPEWYPDMDRGLACIKGVGAKLLPYQIVSNVQRIGDAASELDRIINELS